MIIRCHALAGAVTIPEESDRLRQLASCLESAHGLWKRKMRRRAANDG